MTSIADALAKIEQVVDQIPEPPTDEDFANALDAFDQFTLPYIETMMSLHTLVESSELKPLGALLQSPDLANVFAVPSVPKDGAQLKRIAPLTLTDLLPDQLLGLFGTDGLLVEQALSPTKALENAIASMKELSPAISQLTDDKWVVATTQEFTEVQNLFDEAMAHLIENLEECLSEGVIGDVFEKTEDVLEILSETESIVDSRVTEVIEALDAVVSVLEDVAELFESTKEVWVLYDSLGA